LAAIRLAELRKEMLPGAWLAFAEAIGKGRQELREMVEVLDMRKTAQAEREAELLLGGLEIEREIIEAYEEHIAHVEELEMLEQRQADSRRERADALFDDQLTEIDNLRRIRAFEDKLAQQRDADYATANAGLGFMMSNLVRVGVEIAKLAARTQGDFWAGFREGIKGTIEGLDTMREVGVEVGRTLANSFGSAFEDQFSQIILGTKKAKDAFKDFARAILADIARLISRLIALWIIKKALGFVGGGSPAMNASQGSSNTMLAKGGVLDRGNLVPFDRGGIVTQPTMFPMSRGRVGLMGEAGPEAVMPLTRGRGGKLGVQASGASNLNVYLSVTSLDPKTAASVILENMRLIQDGIAGALIDGSHRNLRVAVRSA
jgi:hypothetical protein